MFQENNPDAARMHHTKYIASYCKYVSAFLYLVPVPNRKESNILVPGTRYVVFHDLELEIQPSKGKSIAHRCLWLYV